MREDELDDPTLPYVYLFRELHDIVFEKNESLHAAAKFNLTAEILEQREIKLRNAIEKQRKADRGDDF